MGQTTSAPLADSTKAATTQAGMMDDDDTKDIVMIEHLGAVPSHAPTMSDTTAVCGDDETRPNDDGAHCDDRDNDAYSDSVGTVETLSSRRLIVPSDAAPICSQVDLEAALAAVQDPSSVVRLSLAFSHKHPIADPTLLNERGHIVMDGDDIDAVYGDAVKNAFHLTALLSFTRLSEIEIVTDDGCCHPVFVTVPRTVWARLSSLTGDWATFRVLN